MAFNDGFSETAAVRSLQGNTYQNIALSAQTLVKSGAGWLHGIAVNSQNISAMKIYDNVVSGGNVIASLTASAQTSGPWYQFDVNFNNGLVISSGSSNTDITISFQ